MVLPARRVDGALRASAAVHSYLHFTTGWLGEENVAKFTLLTAIGVSLWVTLLAVIGYALGGGWNKMIKAFGFAGYVVAAMMVVAVVVFMVRRYRSSRVRGESTERHGSPLWSASLSRATRSRSSTSGA